MFGLNFSYSRLPCEIVAVPTVAVGPCVPIQQFILNRAIVDRILMYIPTEPRYPCWNFPSWILSCIISLLVLPDDYRDGRVMITDDVMSGYNFYFWWSVQYYAWYMCYVGHALVFLDLYIWIYSLEPCKISCCVGHCMQTTSPWNYPPVFSESQLSTQDSEGKASS